MLQFRVRRHLQGLVIFVDHAGEVGRISAAVALRSNVKRRLGVLWVSIQEEFKECVDVLSGNRRG